jgi:hypothetical protein
VRTRVAIAAAVSAWFGAAAAGQEDAAEIPAPKDRWSIHVEPFVWYGSAGGKVALAGAPVGTPRVGLPQLNADNPELIPGAEISLRDGDWTFSLSGFRLESDGSTDIPFSGNVGPVAFNAGDRLDTSLRITSIEATAMRKIELPASLQGTHGRFEARLDALAGLRVYDVGFELSAPSGLASADEFYIHPIVGAKFAMDIMEQFTIDLQVDFGAMTNGGDQSSFDYNIVAGFMWRPTPMVGVQIGYRDLAYLLKSGPEGDRFDYRGAIQGLYAGVVLRF